MKRKALAWILVLLLSISIVGCAETSSKAEGEPQNQDEAAVNRVVEDFGRKLQLVSLLAPEDVLEKSMQEHYGGFVSPGLLEQWLKDPVNAPGRLTSSPWPDRIEILSTEKISEEAYEVKGEIIEVADVEKKEIVAKRPIILVVEKTDGKWMICDAAIEEMNEREGIIQS